jgi:hypothetical protein
MDRIARSFRLVQQSYRILMHDKELMILPLISGAITLVVAVSFFFTFQFTKGGFEEGDPVTYVAAFLLYVVTYAIGIFFQAAVVAGATERMRGGDPTLASSLGAAWKKIGSIIAWAVVAATVGTILRAISDRAGWLGKFAVGLLGAAWSLVTFFVVPVLVLEERSITDSFKRSWEVFKKTWGETVVGSAGVGIAAFVAWVCLAAVVALLAAMGVTIVAIIIGVAGAISLILFFAAIQGVYVASLYRYATEGKEAGGFDHDLLANAFVPK